MFDTNTDPYEVTDNETSCQKHLKSLEINEESDTSQYLLHDAVRQRNYDKLSELIKISTIKNIDFLDDNDDTALDIAASLGDYQSTKLLLEAGAKPAFQASFSRPTPTFSNALQAGNLEVIAALLKSGCDPDLFISQQFSRSENRIRTYWDLAISIQNWKVMKCLIDHCPNAIQNNEKFRKLLLSSIDRNATDIIQLLLELDAPYKENREDRFQGALRHAMISDNVVIFDLLRRHGLDPNTRNEEGETLLHQATDTLNTKFVEIILAAGADVEALSDKNDTPLHVALKTKYFATVELLLRSGADPNALDNSGSRPLQIVEKQSKSIVDALLKHGADPEAWDADGRPVLHWAAMHNRRLLDYMLFKSNVRVDVRDKANRTILQCAIESKSLESIGILLDYGADVNLLNIDQKNKLDESVRHALAEAVVRRKVAGLKVDDKLMSLCDWENNKLERYRMSCAEETRYLNVTNLHNWCTYFDLLHEKNEKLMKLVKQAGVRLTFQRQLHRHQFPIYTCLLNRQFIVGDRLEAHYDKAATSLFVMSELRFPSLLLRKILQHLDVFDVVNLANL